MNKNNIVIKKIADNFWVKTPKSVVCCKPMGKLKKSGVFVGDKVELGGTFCMGKCQQGVCVTVDDNFFSVTPDTVSEFFYKEVVAKVK